MDITRNWVDTGEFYLPHQLAGPYQVQTLVDVLYPPIALYLFVPFLVLPAVLWWAIPMSVFRREHRLAPSRALDLAAHRPRSRLATDARPAALWQHQHVGRRDDRRRAWSSPGPA